jgi:hypothetical protein
VPGVSIGGSRFSGDDGATDPRVAAALAAFAAGQGSEQAALQALADARLLVPVVAVAVTPGPGPGDSGPGCGGGPTAERSEMSMPTLVGQDGRAAVPAFTGLDALARWRADARPVPEAAAAVWQAAVAGQCAVVIDVAGPVPLAVDGARLAALARGEPPPAPHEDPDVLAVVTAAAAGLDGLAGAAPGPGRGGSDLGVRLTLAPGVTGETAQQAAAALAGRVQAQLGGRLRRGISVTLAPTAPAPGPAPGDQPGNRRRGRLAWPGRRDH